jgi:radical SAM protein with 4Fe4S-binding SPASM domain
MESIKGLKIDGICFSHLNFVTKEMAEIHNNSFAHIGRATPTTLSLVNLDEINPKILSKQLITVKKKYSKMNINFSPSIFSSKEIETYYRQPLKIISQDRCTVVWESAQIIANGDVIPITRCFNVKLGNIYENSFREIWNGYKMRQFRKILKKYRHFPVCSRCCALLK